MGVQNCIKVCAAVHDNNNNNNNYYYYYYYYTVSQKKLHPFYSCDIFVEFYPILPIFGKNILQEIWNKHKSKGNHTSFHMFVLYRVNSSDDLYGIPYYIHTASNMKSTHKSQIVTSDNCQVTFILSKQVFEVSSISSHTGAQPSTPRGRLPRR